VVRVEFLDQVYCRHDTGVFGRVRTGGDNDGRIAVATCLDTDHRIPSGRITEDVVWLSYLLYSCD
jgi:hypothetical protein